MRTDRRPSQAGACREYDKSGGQIKIHIPPSTKLKPLFAQIGVVADAENSAGLKQACSEFLGELSLFYGILPPGLKLLGPRPHSTYEGVLASELFGDYHLEQARIRVWTRTAMKKRWTSSKTILSTLCHEFMHHLDVIHLDFPHTYHTVGFFERTHRLYLSALGHPYYPIAWRSSGHSNPGGLQSIDWSETNRRKARVLVRAR